MQSLNFDTGLIVLSINNDESKTISFNPKDVNFANRFYELIQDFKSKEGEMLERAKALDSQTDLDNDGIPVNLPDVFSFTEELDSYFKGQIDHIFGAGTSETCFGSINVMSADHKGRMIFENFLNALSPYIMAERQKKVGKYTEKYLKRK